MEMITVDATKELQRDVWGFDGSRATPFRKVIFYTDGSTQTVIPTGTISDGAAHRQTYTFTVTLQPTQSKVILTFGLFNGRKAREFNIAFVLENE